MPRVEDFAPAKINLFLHVGDKRADGFHPLQSLAVFAGVGDALSFEESDDLSLTIDGPFAAGLSQDPDNLVLRAARALAARSGIAAGAKIVLTKNLPVASGIGGGSADAAAALRGLSQLWKRDIDKAALREIGASIGSDVPVCIESGPSWMEGRGEILTPISGLPDLHMVLVNPGVAVSTAEVFRTLKDRCGVALHLPDAFADAASLIAFLQSTSNDLEAPACTIQPVIREALALLGAQPNALLARMSGSGATCFALFADQFHADAAALSIQHAHADWWSVATPFHHGRP